MQGLLKLGTIIDSSKNNATTANHLKHHACVVFSHTCNTEIPKAPLMTKTMWKVKKKIK